MLQLSKNLALLKHNMIPKNISWSNEHSSMEGKTSYSWALKTCQSRGWIILLIPVIILNKVSLTESGIVFLFGLWVLISQCRSSGITESDWNPLWRSLKPEEFSFVWGLSGDRSCAYWLFLSPSQRKPPQKEKRDAKLSGNMVDGKEYLMRMCWISLIPPSLVLHQCREPVRESPPMTRSCGRVLVGKASQNSRGAPLGLPERLPQNLSLSVLLLHDFHQLFWH